MRTNETRRKARKRLASWVRPFPASASRRCTLARYPGGLSRRASKAMPSTTELATSSNLDDLSVGT